MKKENNWWYISFSFIIGVLICYFLTQFNYFLIDTKINVIETLLSIIVALIGFYIAISIQKIFIKNQNQYSFIISKLDELWKEYNKYSQIIIINNELELKTLSRFNKNFY